jgi:hypothetical protein
MVWRESSNGYRVSLTPQSPTTLNLSDTHRRLKVRPWELHPIPEVAEATV